MSNHRTMGHAAMPAATKMPMSDMSSMSGMDMPGMMHHNGSMSMMKMWFHVDLNDYLLFKPWLITNSKEMAAAFFGMFVLAALYEGLKILREHLLTRASHRSYAPEHEYEVPNGNTGGAGDVRVRRNPVIRRLPMLSAAHLLQTVLHMLQVFLSYILMLVFMTYNVWLCLAVILGAGTGYFLFSWKRTVLLEDLTEHCH